MKKNFFIFLPMIIFFVTYKIYNIYIATLFIIITTFFQLIYQLIVIKKKIVIHLVIFIVIFVLGMLTIYFHNENLIKLKVTIINWFFGVSMYFSKYIMKEPLIKNIIDHPNLILSKNNWNKMNNIWSLFFVFLGTLNLLIIYFFSTNFWVNFKLFGIVILTIIFIIIQSIFLVNNYSKKN